MTNSADNTDVARDALDDEISSLAREVSGVKLGSLPEASSIDDELLLRYFDGAVSASERTSLEQRLVGDRDAMERLAVLAIAHDDVGISRQRPLPVPAISRAVNAASRYVFHVAGGLLELLRGSEGASILQPAMTVRGSVPSGQPAAYAVEREFQTAQGALSARFELHAEQSNDNALVDLVVHVGAGGSHADGIRCKLIRDGRPIDSREVEGNGCTFARLGPARYDVELRKGGVEVGRLLFDLRG